MKTYETEQRRLLLDFIKKHAERQFTAEAIARELCSGQAISVSAIYRNLAKLAEEGMVRKFHQEGSRTALYQYWSRQSCHEHLHLKCTVCGCVLHMDDDASEGIVEKVRLQNDFRVDGEKTILYGRCEACD